MIYSVGDISLLYLFNYIKLIVIVSSVIENKSENTLMKCYATVQVPGFFCCLFFVFFFKKARGREGGMERKREGRRKKGEREGGKKKTHPGL